jgi:hypothetical protein
MRFVEVLWATVYMIAIPAPILVVLSPIFWSYTVPMEYRWLLGVWIFFGLFGMLPLMIWWLFGPLETFDRWLRRRYP